MSRESPSLTVIMPTYNAEDTVVAAVRSTLACLPPDSRLIVRDDASTDTTAERVHACSDSRLTVIEGSENLGVAEGLNLLLEMVEGPLVARMDADDLCLPWRFSKSLGALKNSDVVFTSAAGMTEQRALTLRNIPFGISQEWFPIHLLIGNPVTHSTMLGRTVVLREAGGYRKAVAEDYDLWLRLASRGQRMRRIALPTIRYRYHSGQLTAGTNWVESLRADAILRDSYNELSEKILDSDPHWLMDLMNAWHGSSPEVGCLSEFGRKIRMASPRGSLFARYILEERLRKYGI